MVQALVSRKKYVKNVQFSQKNPEWRSKHMASYISDLAEALTCQEWTIVMPLDILL